SGSTSGSMGVWKAMEDRRGDERPVTAPTGSPGSGGETDGIAVIGLACRFPGAPDPAALWDLLRGGGEAVRDTPADRWNADDLYSPDPDAPGRVPTRRGAFLDAIDRFDAAFFGISPRAAAAIDPQQDRKSTRVNSSHVKITY